MEKKSFIERYKEWKGKVDSWAADHTVLGFPVRHPSIFLIICFTVVLVVCGSLNASARRKAEVSASTTSVVQPRIQKAAYTPEYIFNDGGYTELYWSSSDGESGVAYDGHLAGFDYNSMFDGRYLNIGLLHDYIDSNYPNLSFTFSIDWTGTWFQCDGGSFGLNGVELLGSAVQIDYRVGNSAMTSVNSYTFSMTEGNTVIALPNGYFKEFSYAYDHSFRLQTVAYYDDGVDSYSYNQGYDAGYNNGKTDGYDEGYLTGHNVGKEEGFQLGQSSDMTLTTLFWSVIDEPFAIIYRLLNFDVLGVNVFQFVMGIVTVGLIGFVIKLII